MDSGGDADDLDIRGGGIVAVDTESLRTAAGRLRLAADDCDGALDRLVAAARALAPTETWVYLWTNEAHAAGDAARRLAADLQSMADLYEVVELQAAAQAAMAGGDAVTAGALHARAGAILTANPAVLAQSALEWLRWRAEVPTAIYDQFGGMGGFGITGIDVLGLVLVGALGAVDAGSVPRGTRLSGAASAVTVHSIGGGRTTAPTGLTQIADRIPSGAGRVRVERYVMPDGSRRFAVYIAGTAFDGPSDEAWDMSSNLALYSRSRAASYDAVLAALAQSGVEPGDEVTVNGHSQGAMVGSFLTLSERFEVPMLVTFGDPIQADVGERTLSVAIRHLDDPVSSLAGAGFGVAVGAAGSFVASSHSPKTLLQGEGPIDRHHLSSYRQTAQALDASTDPRMSGVRARLAELGTASSVDAVVYAAAREPTPARRLPPRHPPGRGLSGVSGISGGSAISGVRGGAAEGGG